MEEYNRLLNEINSYLELDDIGNNNEIISAYNLYEILNNRFENLRKIFDGEELLQKILDDHNKLIKKLGLFLKHEKNSFKHYNSGFIIPEIKNNKSEIHFSFMKNCRMRGGTSFRICKDVNNKEIYFDQYFEPLESFVQKYYDDIMYYFNILEEYSVLLNSSLKLDQKNIITNKFTDDFLDIEVSYDYCGCVNVRISIEKKEDPNGIFKREWYNQKQLSSIVEENKFEILKKVLVNVQDLDQVSKNILNEALNKEKVYIKTM